MNNKFIVIHWTLNGANVFLSSQVNANGTWQFSVYHSWDSPCAAQQVRLCVVLCCSQKVLRTSWCRGHFLSFCFRFPFHSNQVYGEGFSSHEGIVVWRTALKKCVCVEDCWCLIKCLWCCGAVTFSMGGWGELKINEAPWFTLLTMRWSWIWITVCVWVCVFYDRATVDLHSPSLFVFLSTCIYVETYVKVSVLALQTPQSIHTTSLTHSSIRTTLAEFVLKNSLTDRQSTEFSAASVDTSPCSFSWRRRFEPLTLSRLLYPLSHHVVLKLAHYALAGNADRQPEDSAVL